MAPPVWKISSGRVMFHCSAGPAMNGLIVEPGSYGRTSTRLRRISGVESSRFCGLNVGQLASASTSPVRGSITTTSPRLAWNSLAGRGQFLLGDHLDVGVDRQDQMLAVLGGR